MRQPALGLHFILGQARSAARRRLTLTFGVVIGKTAMPPRSTPPQHTATQWLAIFLGVALLAVVGWFVWSTPPCASGRYEVSVGGPVLFLFKCQSNGSTPATQIAWHRRINQANTGEYMCTGNGKDFGSWRHCKNDGTCGDELKIIQLCEKLYHREAQARFAAPQ